MEKERRGGERRGERERKDEIIAVAWLESDGAGRRRAWLPLPVNQ